MIHIALSSRPQRRDPGDRAQRLSPWVPDKR